MDNRNAITSSRIFFLTIVLFVSVGSVIPQSGIAQSNTYEVLPAPDVWYNSVDGVRIGARVLGQVPGSFGDGPHRLNAGLWLGTKFPQNPVSYYVKFTEPIPAISDFGSEGSVSIESLFRTGFQSHGLQFKKRFQAGFNEQNYKEISLEFRAENRFDYDYLLYPQLWQDSWLYLVELKFDITNKNGLGRYFLNINSVGSVVGDYGGFWKGELAFQQHIPISDQFKFFTRIYSGLASNETPPEYLFARSFQSPRSWMHKGLTRARGTIPPSWMRSGNLQVTGGPNLRGYLEQDVDALNNFGRPLYTSLSALNVEMDYPNPLDKAINDIPVLGGFVNLRSYLFYDMGTSLGITRFEEPNVLADAGLGFQFSINIPDYLGKSRGLAIRYDLPFWLSHPGTENSFEFRNVIGIGAIISL